jgi:ABC-type multidrug transport system fused ATPase/permease subunit
MGQDAGFVLGKGLELIAIVVAGVSVSPTLVLIGAIVIYICKRLSTVYLAGAREVRRLESIARGVVYDHFTSNLTGLVTIRAFRRADHYVQCVYTKVDRYTRASWNLWLFNRWLGLRMNIFGAIFSTLTAAFVVYMPQISAGLAGFALSFALQYSSAITQFLRQAASFELDMNAVERVLFYMDIEIEHQGGKSAPASWPTEGQIEVHGLVTGYTPDGPPVLKGLDFHVRPHERIGIVGRTGAGKSSLALALFRFLAIGEGTVYVDGVDISKIKLHDLRSRLAMVPQDPVLFSGTIRSNLDPLHEHTDSDLYDALQRVGLTVQTSSEEPPAGPVNTPAKANTATATETRSVLPLTTPISERGLNLSQGQRQLLCLARAIISRPKVMVIDEGTSAVDMATDRKVQRLIHDEFQTSTLLVIAHRLSTVADFSRILVLDKGEVVEFDTPKQLMEARDGYFRALVEASGERDAVKEVIFG